MTLSVIRPLSEDLINQIAAGEVVERPASVLKELIENSLDSEASQIDIELIEGGLDGIKVLDNGCGISSLDLPLSVQRHATSKIQTASDLEAIGTFGFRGEALSSICSVSQVTITSRTAHDSMGYQITLDEGIVTGPLHLIASPIGTQVSVSCLFKNTPARRKFLRSSHTELSHCQKLIKEIALANPSVRFCLRNENRLLGTWVTPTRRERFQECLKLPWTPLEIHETREEMTLEAYLSPPEQAVARSELYLFINGRPVRHRPFISAIRTAFSESFGFGKEPVGVCYLDLRRDWVDVNVHPQKWEVRCLHQESIYFWLLSTFRKKLSLTSPVSSSSQNSNSKPIKNYSSPRSLTSSYPFSFLFQNEHFLICEDHSGLIIAEIEKLKLSANKRQLTDRWEMKQWPIEPLGIPVIYRPSAKLRSVLERHQSFLSSWGFQCEGFGDGDFSIRTRPSFVEETTVVQFFAEFLTKLGQSTLSENISFQPDLVISWFLDTCQDLPSCQSTFALDDLLKELACQLKHPANESRPDFIHRLSYPTLNRNMRLK